MKNSLKKLTALVLVITFIFTFAACKKSDDSVTTTSAATTVADETTAAEETTIPDDATTLPGETTTQATTLPVETTAAAVTNVAGETAAVPPATTTKPVASIKAPMGGSISQIVAFYNQYANATKEYTGKINVQRDLSTKTTITKMAAIVKGTLQDLLDKKLLPKSENKTFVNGKNPADSNDTLEKFLPRSAGEKMSVLTVPGVKSAACVKDGTGWKIIILLKREVSGIDQVPKYHSSVMDPLEIDSESLKPFTLGNGQVIYGKLDPASDGATLTAKVNSKGYLDTLYMDAPLVISGKLGMFNQGFDTVIEGKFVGDMTFKYY